MEAFFQAIEAHKWATFFVAIFILVLITVLKEK